MAASCFVELTCSMPWWESTLAIQHYCKLSWLNWRPNKAQNCFLIASSKNQELHCPIQCTSGTLVGAILLIVGQIIRLFHSVGNNVATFSVNILRQQTTSARDDVSPTVISCTGATCNLNNRYSWVFWCFCWIWVGQGNCIHT